MRVKIIVGLLAGFVGIIALCAITASVMENSASEPTSTTTTTINSPLARELGCDFIAAEYRATAPYLGHQAGVQNVQASANLKLGINQHVFYADAEKAVKECSE